MHTHIVFFWLNETASAQDRQAFRNGLAHLLQDPKVQSSTIGEPAKTDREVIDNSYDFGIVATFQSLEDHDAYQTGQHHEEFLAACQALWRKVQVYDVHSE